MKKIILNSLLLIILFQPSLVISAEISEKSVNKLMVLSGLNKQVSQFPGLFQAGVEQAKRQGPKLPEEVFIKIKNSIVGSIIPKNILNIISQEVKKNTSEKDVKQLLKWYESNLGKKITKAEENGSTPEAYEKMIKTSKTLLQDSKRVQYAKRFDKLLNATDMTIQLQEKTGVAVFTAISTAMNPNEPVNTDAFRKQMSTNEQEIRSQIEQLVVISFVYSYKKISITNLEKYATFLEQKYTRNFNDSVIRGMNTGLGQAIDTMAKSLTVVFKESIANQK